MLKRRLRHLLTLISEQEAVVVPVTTPRQHIVIGAAGTPVYFNEVADRQHILTSIYYGEDT